MFFSNFHFHHIQSEVLQGLAVTTQVQNNAITFTPWKIWSKVTCHSGICHRLYHMTAARALFHPTIYLYSLSRDISFQTTSWPSVPKTDLHRDVQVCTRGGLIGAWTPAIFSRHLALRSDCKEAPNVAASSACWALWGRRPWRRLGQTPPASGDLWWWLPACTPWLWAPTHDTPPCGERIKKREDRWIRTPPSPQMELFLHFYSRKSHASHHKTSFLHQGELQQSPKSNISRACSL